MNIISRTPTFDTWFATVNDPIAKARITRPESGNFGDCESVGEGVSEMRIHVGAGWRVYFVRRGELIYLLLCGGNKKTQPRDIEYAKQLSRNLEN